MGVELITHIGAYIEIHCAPIKTGETKIFCKKHPDRKITEDEYFCPICGEGLTKEVLFKEKYPTITDLFDDAKEYETIVDTFIKANPMDEPNGVIFLHGNLNTLKEKPYETSESYGETEITSEMIDEYTTNFYNTYKNSIEILKTKVRSLEIKFGVLQYYW